MLQTLSVNRIVQLYVTTMNLLVFRRRTLPALSLRTAPLLVCLCVLFALAAPPGARAEENAAKPTVGQRGKNFAHEAASGLVRDLRIAGIAQRRAAKRPIKAFMSHVARRRMAADAKLRRLVAKTGMTLPTRLDAQQRQQIERLEKLNGAEFDKEALRAIADPAYVRFFEFTLKDPSPQVDPKVKEYAREQLPILRKDMEAAQRWLDGYDRI